MSGEPPSLMQNAADSSHGSGRLSNRLKPDVSLPIETHYMLRSSASRRREADAKWDKSPVIKAPSDSLPEEQDQNPIWDLFNRDPILDF